MRYSELKAYVVVYYRHPNNYKVEFRELLKWAKYTRKKIKAVTLPEDQRLLFEVLEEVGLTNILGEEGRKYRRNIF